MPPSNRPPSVGVTLVEDDRRTREDLGAGAVGYILKRDPPAEIVRAVFDAAAGGAPMSPSIARKVIQHFRAPLPGPLQPSNDEGHLSPRERQIVERLATGYAYKEIAGSLGLSIETVRTHLKRVYRKLRVPSGAAAVAKTLGRRG